MLFFKNKNFEVVETVVQQQIDNAKLIEDLLRQQSELKNSTIEMDKELFEIVANQQVAIRNLQQNIIALQKLTKQNGEI